jgi:LmbE family N-acetylglucosaminyl deacetylase
MIKSTDKILVVAAHPDDEVLGCGATIHKLREKFPEMPIFCVILSEPLASRKSHAVAFDKKDFQEVINASLKVSELLGFTKTYFENLPNNRLDSLDLLEVIKIIEGWIEELKPTIVFTHHKNDLNLAHRITSQAVLTGCRPLEGCSVRVLYSFEIASSTEWNFPTYASIFSPNMFVEVGEAIETKITAMEMYRSERRVFPHPRSPEAIRAAAVRWGSVGNLNMAEAFETIYERVIL